MIGVLSPETEQVDRGEKYLEYAKAGVRGYWIVDPDEQSIEIYILRRNVYQLKEKFKSGEVAESELLPGFEVNINEVFQLPHRGMG